MKSRLGAVAGFASLAISTASMALAPPPPGLDANSSTVVAWHADHAGGIRAYALATAIAAGLLVLWYGGIRQVVWRDEPAAPFGPIATVGAAVAATGWIASAAISSVIALRLDALDPSSVVLGASLAGAFVYGGQLGFAMLLGGIAAEAHHTGALSRWLVVVGGIAAAATLVPLVGVALAGPAVDGAMAASSLVAIVFVLASSIALWRGDRARAVDQQKDPQPAPLLSGLSG